MPHKNTPYLPPEVVQIIVDYLAFEHPPTLMNLAKACKTYYTCCRPAIKSLLFHDIKLPVPRSCRASDKFNAAAKNLVNRLEAAQSFSAVRRLFIPCIRSVRYSWELPTADEEAKSREWEPPRLSDLKCSRADTYTTQYGNWEKSHQMQDCLFSPNSEASDVEEFHRPIVELIKMLPGLTDLTWAWPAEIPPSVLKSLHQYRPHCRLHVDLFFRSDTLGDGDDPRDIQLLKSSSLHTITVACGTRQGCYTFLLRSARLAPSLKVLRFKRDRHNVPYRGLWAIRNRITSGPARLEAMHFEESDDFRSEILCDWSYHTDFSALQTLQIVGKLEDDAFSSWSKAGISFPFLRSLSLCIGSDRARSAEFYESAREFITDMSLLCELELNGWHTIIGIESLVRNGSQLRKLKLLNPPPWQFVNEQEIFLLGERCPLIQDLAIPVLRTQGDAEEVRLYKALGSLKNLQHLDLCYQVTPVTFHHFPRESIYHGSANDLTTINTPPNNPLWSDFENEFSSLSCEGFSLRNGHLKNVMIDSVIDEKLVSAIFTLISENKPPRWPHLKELRLTCTGGTYRGIFTWMVRNFTSKWRAMRNPYSRARKRVLVERLFEDNDGTSRYEPLSEEILPVFYRLFPVALPKGPPRKQSKKLAAKREKERRETAPMWKRYLHSFPLDLTMEGQSASLSRA